ncbi:N-acetylmuramoyl-L-alanine amidase [Micromonospora pattaloongensis]|uniref:N-acetylmuramoyl-L-alanine amidase n=1 Tax=Micromonospora pattaloongensis TaxID=405436 RepID=A0A1H3FHP0_9ACTN|nr:N-acetylmuramoyl-L-alanine amidase [Micromonospora pattaloongensis]SDX90562.1 N-acetylmuramoyl-L-alanine amidase [Micromonospora pattaloongensis]
MAEIFRRSACGRRTFTLGAVGLAVGLSAEVAFGAPRPDPRRPGGLAAAFDRAARRYEVPRDLLAALGYAETHLDGHAGAPSASGGYGVMHLADNGNTDTLDEAAALTGLSAGALRTQPAANIAGAAAVLRSYADAAGLTAAQRRDLSRWYGPVVRYGGVTDPAMARLYGDAVYDLLASGFTAPAEVGALRVAPRSVTPRRGALANVPPVGGPEAVGTLSADYGPAAWVPASRRNYTVANRERSHNINYVVVHVTQGSYAGTINWFRNPISEVSAHYTVRSRDGAITQSVRDKDIAWHAGDWTYNLHSIGIEHEGYISQASWFTDTMYRSSAALTRHLCNRYRIPKDRAHIIGHIEVPGATHTDPGRYWNWNHYLRLVRGGWSTTVDNRTPGRFTASRNWGSSAYSGQRYGDGYRFARPVAASDPAWFLVNIPETASYRVDVWHPADPGYNDRTPYLIATTTGLRSVHLNQRIAGGQWRSLGAFRLARGDRRTVGVSRWTAGAGYVIADAVRVTRV